MEAFLARQGDTKEGFFNPGGHYNALGNEIVADYLLNFLSQLGADLPVEYPH